MVERYYIIHYRSARDDETIAMVPVDVFSEYQWKCITSGQIPHDFWGRSRGEDRRHRLFEEKLCEYIPKNQEYRDIIIDKVLYVDNRI